MHSKKSKVVARFPKNKCPKCRERVDHEVSEKEFREYGPSILPKYGDLTSCGACGTVLEYTSDPSALILQIAPRWRIDLLEEVGKIPEKLSLSEMIQKAQSRKPARLRPYQAPQ